MAQVETISYKNHYPANYFDPVQSDSKEKHLSLHLQITKSRGEMMMWLSHRLVPMTFCSDPDDKLTIESLNIGLLSQNAGLTYDHEDDRFKIELDKTISSQIGRVGYNPSRPLAFTSMGGEVYRKPNLNDKTSYYEFERIHQLPRHKLFIGNAEVNKHINQADDFMSQSILSLIVQLKELNIH